MTIDIENGKRFSEQPVIDAVSSGNDIMLVRLADGTGVKAISMSAVRAFMAGDPSALSTEEKGSVVAAINELAGKESSDRTDIDSLKAIISDCAGSHNAIYRGKYLGSAVTAAQYAAISAGTFEDLYIGDYWTIGGINYRIAAFDYFLNCGDTKMTAHHAVIVPDTCLYNAAMNSTSVTTGGYAGSAMHSTNIAQAKTTIKSAFSGHVLLHREYLVNAVASGRPSSIAWFDSEVELMNEQMVYGGGIFGAVSDGTNVPSNHRIGTSQLPLFRLEPSRINNSDNWWLRDVVDAATFANVYRYGYANYNNASFSLGVRPYFCI